MVEQRVKPTREPGLDRHTRILVAAARTFAEVDYAEAKMDDIAARAGSTKQTVYTRFGSKEALYRACVEREGDLLRRWLFSVYDATASLPWDARMHAGIVAFFQYAAQHPDGFKVLFDQRSTNGTRDGDLVQQVFVPRIAGEIAAYRREHGHDGGPQSAEFLAAMIVGLGIAGITQCLRNDGDLTRAGELAAAAAVQLVQVDVALFDAIDRSS